MKLYEIVGDIDSELEGSVFGHFTSEELAKKALATMAEELREECHVRKSNIEVNTIVVDDEVIRFTEEKDPETTIANAEENGFVKGYVTLHVSDIIENDYEQFLDLLSEGLVGHVCLMEISYSIVECDDDNSITFYVTGYLPDDDE